MGGTQVGLGRADQHPCTPCILICSIMADAQDCSRSTAGSSAFPVSLCTRSDTAVTHHRLRCRPRFPKEEKKGALAEGSEGQHPARELSSTEPREQGAARIGQRRAQRSVDTVRAARHHQEARETRTAAPPRPTHTLGLRSAFGRPSPGGAFGPAAPRPRAQSSGGASRRAVRRPRRSGAGAGAGGAGGGVAAVGCGRVRVVLAVLRGALPPPVRHLGATAGAGGAAGHRGNGLRLPAALARCDVTRRALPSIPAAVPAPRQGAGARRGHGPEAEVTSRARRRRGQRSRGGGKEGSDTQPLFFRFY